MSKKKTAKLEVVKGGLDDDPAFIIPYNKESPLSGTFFHGKKFDNCEFVFQFDDEEPVVFAKSNPTSYKRNLTIMIDNTSSGSLRFTHGDRTFKLFARESKQ